MIEINNQTDININLDLIRSVSLAISEKLKLEKVNLSLALISPQKIRHLNKKYRQIDEVTDVLSFNFSSTTNGHIYPKLKEVNGEIIICYQQANQQAIENGHSVFQEIINLLIHGFLHLLGHEHQFPASRQKMENLEKSVLSYILKNFKPHLQVS